MAKFTDQAESRILAEKSGQQSAGAARPGGLEKTGRHLRRFVAALAAKRALLPARRDVKVPRRASARSASVGQIFAAVATNSVRSRRICYGREGFATVAKGVAGKQHCLGNLSGFRTDMNAHAIAPSFAGAFRPRFR